MEAVKISIEQVKRANEKHGYFYFSEDTMRFFSSRVSSYAFKVGNLAYFITSEQNRLTGNNPRKYSIRVGNLLTGKMDTIGEFQEFNTRAQALGELKRVVTKAEKLATEILTNGL